ncbi:MAG: tetratricopeptide repeat protein [Planctomycetes bacterium]|nr:tetratricopeptide repeat protein [Planctomycetota bacterium]
MFFALVVALAAVVAIVHAPSLRAGAVSFDDHQYWIDNPLVTHPSLASLQRFFSEVFHPSTVRGYYHPLTMASLMLEVALGGGPEHLFAFHLTSLLLHVANVVLVALLLRSLFGHPVAAIGAALLFGVHPVMVEPIPWVSEQKTLLAACFSLLSLLAYTRWVATRRPATYVACLAAFVLALLSKPTSIPLPILFLVLDFWPLARLSARTVLEKTPFLILAATSGIVTFISQSNTGGTHVANGLSLTKVPLVVCYDIVFYPSKLLWPARLCSYYPYPEPFDLSNPSVLAGLVGTLVLVVILTVSLRWTRALVAGWLAFFAAILPTLQIVGFTNVVASDKYAYLPSVGLLLPLAWAMGRAWDQAASIRWKRAGRGAIFASIVVLTVACASRTRDDYPKWKDTETLWRHVLSLAPSGSWAQGGLANSAIRLCLREMRQGRLDEAQLYLEQTIKIWPENPQAHASLAGVLERTGNDEKAIAEYAEAARLDPADGKIRFNAGCLLARLGRLPQAAESFRQAVSLDPADDASRLRLEGIQKRLSEMNN